MEYSKMNAHWKDWWLRALRGGNYKQCRRVLRNKHNECCCFGVLADGMAPAAWKPRQFAEGYGVSIESAAYRLPRSLQQKAGIDDNALLRLERRNDSGWTFAQIANWIEQNL